MTAPTPQALASAARVRELADARPPAGLDSTRLATWYAEQLGALAWHAQALADAIDAAARS